ncbi:MAG: PilZ domain-containing protein [Variibacter sp.]|nr:PilZ domain-containing protein [Variibacter sp.]
MVAVERRKSPRTILNRPGMAMWSQSPRQRCTIHDISARGARVILKQTEEVPEQIIVALTENGKVARKCRVIWRNETHLGVEFQGTTILNLADEPAAAESGDADDALALDC